MSLKSSSYVLERKYGSHVRKLIMLIIADFSNDDGEAWPSIDTLAFKAECSRRAVQDNLTILEQAGEIAVHQNAGPRGCNLYRIIFRNYTPELKTFIPRKQGGAAAAPVQPVGGETAWGGADGRRPAAPEPLGTVKEPSREREEKTRSRSAASPEEIALIASLNQIRPGWAAAPVLNPKEQAALEANLPALLGVTSETWDIIREYYTAKIPEGKPAYRPPSRERFIESAADVITRATDWKRNQRPPKPQTPATAPSSDEPALTQEEIAAILKPKHSLN